MGLDENELERYYGLIVKGLQLKLYLYDMIFNKFILSDILNQEALKYYNMVNKFIHWDCNLLIEQKEMDKIYDEYNKLSNKQAVMNYIDMLYIILRKELINYYNNLDDKTIIDSISMLFSDGLNKDFDNLLLHLDYKFEILYMVLENKEV
jgi:hypothetical protein